MPVILRIDNFSFLFFSNEGNPLEPCHIHVRRNTDLAKFWLIPVVLLADNYGFSSQELNRIKKIVTENRELFIQKWNEYFNL